MIKAINIDDSEVQIQVVKSLGNLSNYRKAKSALMRLLYHRDNTIRQEAKSALGVTPPAKEPN